MDLPIKCKWTIATTVAKDDTGLGLAKEDDLDLSFSLPPLQILFLGLCTSQVAWKMRLVVATDF